MNEIKLLRAFDHPNMAKIYDVFDSEDHLILVMEYMDGGNLASLIKKKGKGVEIKLNEKSILHILRQILEALRYLHKLNIVHRDIKPANIMFKSEFKAPNSLNSMRVKIIDFGLCANVLDHSPQSLLNDKSGTVGYLSPELIGMKRGRFYDQRADVFSAGMVFYEM